MKENIQCDDVERIKPLDEMFEDQMIEFESGGDKVCDKDLDKMIWELGDYGNEEPPMEAAEFEEDKPVEEELIEKKMIHGSNELPYYMERSSDGKFDKGVVTARSISPEHRRRRSSIARIASQRKKKH